MDELYEILSTSPVTSQLTVSQVILSLFTTFVLTRIIILTYHRTVDNPLPSKEISNHISLIALVTTLVIMPISTNAILSLGMVGALSVVRFRTAIKSPTDTAFVYWAIAIGIALGAQFFVPAIVGTIFLAMLMEVNRFMSGKSVEKYVVNLEFNHTDELSIQENIGIRPTLISRVQRDEIVYLCIEVSKPDDMEKIRALENIIQSEIVSYKGDFIQ